MRRLLLLALLAFAGISSSAPASAQQQVDTFQVIESQLPRVAPATAIEATIRIDKIQVKAPVYMGVTMSIFAKGVGQWPGTPRPGRAGNIVLGGHRTSGTKPFADIDKLAAGDIITLTTRGLTYRYAVTGSIIVKPTAMWITDPTRKATLTLFACHPKGKTTQRYVVRATLVK